jgi:gliding motility-associated-like protein
MLRTVRIKRDWRFLFLLAFFTLTYFSALAQVPKPSWVDDLGGASGSAYATYLAVDNQNDVYVTGEFQGTVDFDPSLGVKYLTSMGSYDIFLGKYKPDGSLIWAVSFGGTGVDQSNCVAVDKDGNVSIVGNFSSPTMDADPGPGVYNFNNPSGTPIPFVIHLDMNGNFLWGSCFAGQGNSGSLGITDSYQVATDSQDNVITTSLFSAPLTVGDTSYSPSYGGDGLVVKYGASGNVLWSLNFFSPGFENEASAYGVRVDGADNIVIAGSFTSTLNVNPLGTAFNLTASNGNTSFIAKYSPTGALIWANGIDYAVSSLSYPYCTVDVDQANNVYFSVPFAGSIVFNPSAAMTSTGNSDNIAIAKYSSTGVFQFSRDISGNSFIDYNTCMASDKNNSLYLTGGFKGTIIFNPGAANAVSLTANGPFNFYVAKYDSNGNYSYAFNSGSPNCTTTSSNSLSIDANNNIDVAGGFCSTVNFDQSSCSSYGLTAMGQTDAFVVQYGSSAISNNIITQPAISSFCVTGSPSAITGSLPTGGSGTYTYQWQSSTDSVNFVAITGATGQDYTPPTVSATTYFERIATATSCASPGTSNVIALTISTPPTAPVVPAVTTCVGSMATLSVTSPQQGYTYNWYTTAIGDTAVFTGVSFTTPSLSDSVTFYVVAAYSTGCVSTTRTTATVTIVQPLAAPVVTVGPATGSTIVFEWAAVTGATSYQVSTDNGQTYSVVAGLTDTVSGLQAGQSVTILVQAIGVVPCQLSAASVAITGLAISPTDDIIYVPNVFTPNGDGTNDIAHAHGDNIANLRFYIYDQWGELIFSSTSVQNGWDGTYKGAREPVGVYVYYVQATMKDGKNITKKGSITLIR